MFTRPLLNTQVKVSTRKIVLKSMKEKKKLVKEFNRVIVKMLLEWNLIILHHNNGLTR